MNTKELTKLAIATLEDMKGIDIQVIDVAGLTSVTDHLVICTGTSSRHVKAMAGEVVDKALAAKVRPLSAQGLEQGDWALVDLNGVVVHMMLASARATYQLEKLWDLGQAKPVLDEPKPAKKSPAKPAKPVKKAAAKAKPVAPKKPAAVKKAAAPAKPQAKAPATTKIKPTTIAKLKPGKLKAAPASPAAKAPASKLMKGVKVLKSVEAKSNAPAAKTAPKKAAAKKKA